MPGTADNFTIEHVPLIRSRSLTSYAYPISHSPLGHDNRICGIIYGLGIYITHECRKHAATIT